MQMWRGRKPSLVFDDLCTAREQLGVNYIFFEEEYPFVDLQRGLTLARYMKDLDVPWYANVRADLAADNFTYLKELYGCGWRETSIGVESGSQRVLDLLAKGITVEQAVQAAENLASLGVYALYSFMTDLPGETEAEKMCTYRLMRRLKHVHPQSEFIGPQVYRLYPKTKWYNSLVQSGLFVEPSSVEDWVCSGKALFYAQ
jgi:anaerobic magnesium-protoporphyrin IX monomethyl ester cyclase